MGASKEKLILGIPTYGRSFTLSTSTKTPPNAYFSGAGNAGPILNQAGFLGYQEICLYLKNDGWTEASIPAFYICICSYIKTCNHGYFGSIFYRSMMLILDLMLTKIING